MKRTQHRNTNPHIPTCVAGEWDYFEADKMSVSVPIMSGYPFGMFPKTTNLRFSSFSNAALAVEIKERSWSVSSYRYGFNGMEKDDELKGNGNSLDFGARIYDSRVSRFLSRDPLQKKYPFYTPYLFSRNTPIWTIDVGGLEGEPATIEKKVSVMIIIVSASEIKNDYNNQTRYSFDQTEVFIATDIESAAASMKAFLGDREVSNLVIDLHARQNTYQSNQPIMELKTSYEDNGGTEVFIESSDIWKYRDSPARSGSGKKAEESRDVNALKQIINSVEDGGSIVVSGCAAGLDANLGNQLVNLSAKSVNIFMNKDLSTPQKITNAGKTTGFIITTDGDNLAGGWIRFNKEAQSPVRGDGNNGNISVSTDTGLKVEEVKIKEDGE
jgi:RHS repeat-associated protein